MVSEMTAYLIGALLNHDADAPDLPSQLLPEHARHLRRYGLVTSCHADSPTPRRPVPGYWASAGMIFVNYSISLGLGFAGMVACEANKGGCTYGNKEKGYRDTLYFELRLSGLGLMLSLVFLVKEHFH
ncbi:hypothetical protein BDV10DRAFT_46683 [Aspergillus recurvatus]